MDKAEFIEWQSRLKANGFEKMSAKTGLAVEDLRAWRMGVEPIPYYVRLVFLAVFHRLDEVTPGLRSE